MAFAILNAAQVDGLAVVVVMQVALVLFCCRRSRRFEAVSREGKNHGIEQQAFFGFRTVDIGE